MLITDISIHKVNLPLVTGYRWASGVYLGATKGLVEVHTDAGIIGWGEVATIEQADIVTMSLRHALWVWIHRTLMTVVADACRKSVRC